MKSLYLLSSEAEIVMVQTHLHLNALVELLASGRDGLCCAKLKIPKLVFHPMEKERG